MPKTASSPMPLAGVLVTPRPTGILAAANLRSPPGVRIETVTFFWRVDGDSPGIAHSHNVGATRRASPTCTPRTALTSRGVRREQGSPGGAPYAGRAPQAASTQKTPTTKAIECFE